MTILAYTPPFNPVPDTKIEFKPTRHLLSRPRNSDRWIGALFGAGILTICCAAAFTGGLSVSTGGVEMNLTGSLSQGLQLQFAAINSCLLYTSPSPRDQRGSRMPSSA